MQIPATEEGKIIRKYRLLFYNQNFRPYHSKRRTLCWMEFRRRKINHIILCYCRCLRNSTRITSQQVNLDHCLCVAKNVQMSFHPYFLMFCTVRSINANKCMFFLTKLIYSITEGCKRAYFGLFLHDYSPTAWS